MPSHFLALDPLGPAVKSRSLPQSAPRKKSMVRRVNEPYLGVCVLSCISMLPLRVQCCPCAFDAALARLILTAVRAPRPNAIFAGCSPIIHDVQHMELAILKH